VEGVVNALLFRRGTAALRYSNAAMELGEGRGAARGGSSFGRADAEQVCNKVGTVPVDGQCECSPATAARQIVSERW
jgi:hypothetical protein